MEVTGRPAQDDTFFFQGSALEYMNLVAAAVIITLTVAIVVLFTYRRIVVRKRNMRWCTSLTRLTVTISGND